MTRIYESTYFEVHYCHADSILGKYPSYREAHKAIINAMTDNKFTFYTLKITVQTIKKTNGEILFETITKFQV